MKKFIINIALATMLTLSLGASARTLATASAPNGDRISLTDEPCTLATMKAIVPAPLQDQFRRAESIVSKQRYEACYLQRGDTVVLIYEDGDVGQVPSGIFKDGKVL